MGMPRKQSPQYMIDCTACGLSKLLAIGEVSVVRHPKLNVTICRECILFSQADVTPLDEDGDEMYCKWCTEVGRLVFCHECNTPFCKDCIVRNFDQDYYGVVESSEKWKCFCCEAEPLSKLTATLKLVLAFQERGEVTPEFTEQCEGVFSGLEMTQSDIETIVEERVKLRNKNNTNVELVESEEEPDEEPEPVKKKKKSGSRRGRPKKSNSNVKKRKKTFTSVEIIDSDSPSGDSKSNDEWKGWDSDKDRKKNPDRSYTSSTSPLKKGHGKRKRKSLRSTDRSNSRNKKSGSDSEGENSDVERSSTRSKKTKKQNKTKSKKFDAIKLTNSHKNTKAAKTDTFILKSKKKRKVSKDEDEANDGSENSNKSEDSEIENASNNKLEIDSSEVEGKEKKEKKEKKERKEEKEKKQKSSNSKAKLAALSSDDELLVKSNENKGELQDLPRIDMEFKGGLTDDDDGILVLDEPDEAKSKEDSSAKSDKDEVDSIAIAKETKNIEDKAEKISPVVPKKKKKRKSVHSAAKKKNTEKKRNVSSEKELSLSPSDDDDVPIGQQDSIVKDAENIEAEVDEELEKCEAKKRKGSSKQSTKHNRKKPNADTKAVDEEEEEISDDAEAEKVSKRGKVKELKRSLVVPKTKKKRKDWSASAGKKKRKVSSEEELSDSLSNDDVPIGQRVGA